MRSVSRLGWKLWLQVTLARTANIASAAKDWHAPAQHSFQWRPLCARVGEGKA